MDVPEQLPDGLKAAGARLWRSIAGPFELDDHEQSILLQACRTADLMDAIAADLVDAPRTVTNARGDLTAHPLLNEHRQQAVVLARLLAALRVPTGEEESRPQRRTGVRGVHQPRRLYGAENAGVA